MPVQSPIQTKTTTSVVYPIISALVAAEAELGPNRQWTATNDAQQQFLATAFGPSRNEVSGIPEIESTSSRNYEVVNEFLRSRGFSIQLSPFQRPDDFGTASVLKLALEWLEKGTETQVQTQGDETQLYPAVRMNGGVRFFNAPNHPHTVVRLSTKSGDDVYLTMMDQPVSEDQLSNKAIELLGNLTYSNREFEGVIFPMVDLDVQPDITWLLSMNTTGDDGKPGIISQALQQTKFSMDEIGAKVQSAVAIAVSRGIGPAPHRINKPFLTVVKRFGLNKPLFVGYIDTDCWKKPAR